MATVNKNFKIKSGLVVEGTTGTINGEDILTKAQADIDYIVDQVGGSGESTNTPNTLVLRDANGDFAAGDVTVNQLNIGSIGNIHDDGDLIIENTDNQDVVINAEDIRLNPADDFRVNAGGAVVFESVDHTRFVGGAVHIGFPVTAENEVATKGYVDDSIGNIDLTFNSDEITEGTTNLYYTDTRVDSHLSGGDGIAYSAGVISADLGTGLDIQAGQIQINRTTVDGWYEANGAVSDHNDLTSGVHGVTGDVVGTTDIQDISNKRVIDTLNFSDGVTIANEGEIAVKAGTHEFEVKSNNGDLHLITVSAGSDVVITSDTGDIVLNADGTAYYGSASAENEIATHGYVDNAISGLTWKQSVNLLATSNVSLTGGNSSFPIDGHAFPGSSYRILLTNQSTASENGIYNYSGIDEIWTRSADADTFEELVGAAVYVMEGDQYGSTSWVQGNHYLSDFTGQSWTQFSGQGSVTAGTGIVVDGLEVSVDFTVVAEVQDLTDGLALKQDELTAGSNIDITGATISVTGLASTDISDFNTAALSATASAYDATGTAQGLVDALDTDDIEEGATNLYFTNQRAIDAVGGTIGDQIDLLDTDDIEEGATNQYFTDTRAQDAAAALLTGTGTTLTNITITGTGSGLTITAENGVADSTTDDLDEGSTNLYFTDARAQGAVNDTTPNFAAVEIDLVAKQVASTLDATTAGIHAGYAFAKADYRSAEFLVKVAYGTHTEISKVLLTLDTSDNIAITEYGIVGTNGSASTVSADISGTNVRLLVTTTNNDSTVTVMGTLLV